MKLKKTAILLIFVSLMLFVATASATELNDIDTTSNQDIDLKDTLSTDINIDNLKNSNENNSFSNLNEEIVNNTANEL